MLAHTGEWMVPGIKRRSDCLAPPPQLAAQLLETAGGIWKGRIPANGEVAIQAQLAWPLALAGADLRTRTHPSATFTPPESIPWQMGQRSLPIALQPRTRHIAFLITNARMVSIGATPNRIHCSWAGLETNAHIPAFLGALLGITDHSSHNQCEESPISGKSKIWIRAIQVFQLDGIPAPVSTDGTLVGASYRELESASKN